MRNGNHGSFTSFIRRLPSGLLLFGIFDDLKLDLKRRRPRIASVCESIKTLLAALSTGTYGS
jgi:hypothetical protein